MFGLTRTHGNHPEMMAEGMKTYGVLLNQIMRRLNEGEVTPLVMVRSLPLWTFVHGLSFLLIDDKLTALKLQVEVSILIRDPSAACWRTDAGADGPCNPRCVAGKWRRHQGESRMAQGIVITGAGSGIGRATARAFLDGGLEASR